MAIPPWKLLILERRKKQEDEKKVRQSQENEAKLASMPAWRRAILLREKQATSGGVISPAPPTTAKPSNKWQVAVERVKGPDYPILERKPWSSTDNQPPATISALNKQTNKKSNSDTKQLVDRRKHITSTTSVPSAATSNVKSITPATSSSDDDSTFAGMPAWKKALILKKRGQTPTSDNVSHNRNGNKSKLIGEDEPDSAGILDTSPPVAADAPVLNHVSKQTVVNHVSKPSVSRQPEVVNRVEGDASNQRLIEQEGITLHAPVYKEVDEWANVAEEDTKFKDLPLWKQALIKRRRTDIAKRSGLPVPASATASATASPKRSGPVPASATASPKRSGPVPASATASPKRSGPVPASATASPKRSGTSATKRSGSVPASSSKKLVADKKFPTSTNHHNENNKRLQTDNYHNTSSKQSSITVKESLKPVRKAPLPPAKEEAMFTFKFSKVSNHHQLDTGGASSDSTDSEMEDTVITNIDDDDSDDGGIVLQHYSAMESSPTIGKKSMSDSSINASPTPVVKKKKHLRRVSWSDTQLVNRHYYPKYDYADYDEIEQNSDQNASTTPSHDNSGLSQRIHPSLRQNDTSPYGYGFSSPRSPTSEKSLSTFVPKNLTYSPQILGGYSEPASVTAERTREESRQPTEEQENDFYADLTANTAALLW